MIRLQPISTSDLQHYKFMEELLIDSFPPEEYRQLEQLREYTDRTGNFHNNIIFDDELPVGVHADEGQAVADDREDDHADHGAGNLADAAGK